MSASPALAKPDEAVAVSHFTIAPWPGQASTIEILYPLAALRSVEPELAAKSHDEAGPRNGDWRERLGAASARSASRRAPCSPGPNCRSPS